MTTTVATTPRLDPAQYEIFRHRLFTILEQGRLAIKMVSGSPVVVEGGETMCAFYASDGTPILSAAGVLLHGMAAYEFVRKAIDLYEDDPGIADGDQLFFNDPYTSGQHLPDMVILKPIFSQGRRIAWTGSIMHTVEVGGLRPGGMPPDATCIFQEGIRITGLKIVEKGKFRPDVFTTIVNQVRDPHLVGLDTKAKIAANNVCARAYLKLIDQYGLEFVEEASHRLITDSEKMARARLRQLPDGVWRSRHYGDHSGVALRPFKVELTMTKEGDHIIFDYTGSSSQNAGSMNSTYPATWGSLFVALASQLFWNIPWNGGLFAPVELIAPEGTVVNCTYPAACSQGVTSAGTMITQTAVECISKLLYTAGFYDDVTSGWRGGSGAPAFGGINQYGEPCVSSLLEGFSAGIGATPSRDGVHTGGIMMNPTSSISDVESVEMSFPLVYLSRRQTTDSGGAGKFAGGMGAASIYVVHGTEHPLEVALQGVGYLSPPGHAIFGGLPTPFHQNAFVQDSNVTEWFAKRTYPTTADELAQLKGVQWVPQTHRPAPLHQFDLFRYEWCGGGGYGDPLDRDPQRVLRDLHRQVISQRTAQEIYGVVLGPNGKEVDVKASQQLRDEMRQKRLHLAHLVSHRDPVAVELDQITRRLRFHEYLEMVQDAQGRQAILCLRCGYNFGNPNHNYKERALLLEHNPSELPGYRLRSGEHPYVLFQSYFCPGCATQLEVDYICPSLETERSRVLWDCNPRITQRS